MIADRIMFANQNDSNVSFFLCHIHISKWHSEAVDCSECEEFGLTELQKIQHALKIISLLYYYFFSIIKPIKPIIKFQSECSS